ncbi:DNA cytosine methyltransferase [Bradyrhizobium sp. C9]|uniref:DNA cytosine methyltransferase n=1 Tax=Bradyrhizobium sp. C9 TaxID=142585 RepID=UPI0011778EF0|nr:DNA cytosine methyltransferase [Bradyrhizobium sp. C9]
MQIQPLQVDINHLHLFCGLGGGAKGFNKGRAKVGNLFARFRCIGGIDSDPAACRDFENLTGAQASCMDLFSREQYRDFHGHEPPPGWVERGPDDIRRAAGNQHPHIVFLSAPCKGFSGLLSEKMSGTRKYQALNGLTLRGVWLTLEAHKDDPVELYVFENVPRIATRGRHLLDQIIALFRSYGYAVAETTHDCGEIGHLGQSRKRFLLVARHVAKIPTFLYEPVKHPLRGVGEILEKLPIPGIIAGLGGPMHRMPSLQWKTWVRLAFVRAGADWRSLNDLAVQDGHLRDFGIVPDEEWHRGVLGVRRWDETSGTVTGRANPTTGAFSVADPREIRAQDFHGLRVNDWKGTAAAVTTQRSPGSSAQSVADPRVDGHEKSVQLGVGHWDQPSSVVKGDVSVGTGRYAVADPRLERKVFNSAFRIVSWPETSPAVAGPGGAGGGLAVADPRPAQRDDYKQTKYRVTGFDEATGAVIGASTTGNGAFAVADPRHLNWHPGASSSKERVTGWNEHARPVTGSQQVASGAGAVADPRPGFGASTHHHVLKVTGWEQHGGTVTSSTHPAGGALSVADPRLIEGARNSALGVKGWDENAGVVAGETHPTNGAFAVADPRPEALSDTSRDAYLTGGHYGVVPWDEHSGAVPAHAKNNNGPWSVADPRETGEGPASDPAPWDKLPAASDKLVCVIRALDGTWHRPFTTLELAALQGLVDLDNEEERSVLSLDPLDPEWAARVERMNNLLVLDGASDSAWRERIGNMVPPPAAQAIADVCGTTLLAAWSGQTFMMGSTPIWVRPVAVALMASREA